MAKKLSLKSKQKLEIKIGGQKPKVKTQLEMEQKQLDLRPVLSLLEIRKLAKLNIRSMKRKAPLATLLSKKVNISIKKPKVSQRLH